MKVALELQPCCGNRSGIGMYTYELARRMKNQGDLEFCGNLFNFMGRDDNSAALQGIEMPVRECSLLPYGVYRRIWDKMKIPHQSLFPGRSDLTVFFDYIVPPSISGKVITTIHDLTYLRYPETMNSRNLSRIRKGITYSVERSDHIIAVSEFTKREIQTMLDVPKEKISVIYNAPVGLDISGERRCRANDEPGSILFLGTIEPRKNLVRLIHAYSRLKEQRKIPQKLILAGGLGWGHEAIRQAAQESKFREDIVFTGYISAEKKRELLECADVFVFPSLYEGFGIPPLEAMAVGCPVVCADAASLPEVAGDAAEYVDPLDAVHIAEGIWHVLSDDAYAQQMVQSGYAQTKKFTWEASAQRFTELCQSVLG